MLTLLAPHISIAEPFRSVSYHLTDSNATIFAWDIIDFNTENNNPLGYSVIDYHTADHSWLQQPTLSISTKNFQPAINDREILKQLRSLMSEYTNTHSSIHWLPTLRTRGSIEAPNYQKKLDKSAIRSALKKSIMQWWQGRKVQSGKRKSAIISTIRNTSHPYKKSWGYKFKVSSNKIKLTLKRKL